MSLAERHHGWLTKPSAEARVMRPVLSAFSFGYGLAVRGRNRAFDLGLKPSHAAPRPVISVGNLTVGGTGKTPVVAHLAALLRDEGRRPAVLMRGYKAKPGEAGDEQRVLEQLLGPDVPVIANPDRGSAAREFIERRPDVDCFVLDDGFQHRRLRRDVDLVLIDATNPFGFGRLLPRGLLREPLSSLTRASAVIVTRCELVDEAALLATTRTIREHTDAPLFRCRFPGELVDANGRPARPGGAVLAVSGVGNPAAFVASLRADGLEVRDAIAFADHHSYERLDVEIMRQRLGMTSAIVTTLKDWVKLAPLIGDLPVFVRRQRAQIESANGADLSDIVKKVL